MKEHEIRPAELLRNYLKLVEEDAQLHFGAEQRQEIDCVACDGRKISPAFIYSFAFLIIFKYSDFLKLDFILISFFISLFFKSLFSIGCFNKLTTSFIILHDFL